MECSGLAGEISQVLEHVFQVSTHEQFVVKHGLDQAAGADDVSHAPVDADKRPEHRIALADAFFVVADHRKFNAFAVGELALFFLGIDGDADDLGTKLRDLLIVVAEKPRFDRATGRQGFREEEQHDPLAAQLRQLNALAGLGGG